MVLGEENRVIVKLESSSERVVVDGAGDMS